ncbi:MAG: CPXCG motif-containing cysteine-rich protein [Phycisphaeraceae bacterium]|nr:CPXCG motif-containing cysteine-rich protein [Phycisphaeraceae bacterium]
MLDPSAGREQEYVEDCPVCCRPNRIRVRFDRHGRASVDVEPE